MGESASISRSETASRVACSLFFLAAGIGIGAWAGCLPVLSLQNGLDKGELGLTLLWFAFGAILMMIVVGRSSGRFDYSKVSFCGALVFGMALLFIPHLEGAVWLGLAVFVAGAGFGTLDVSMNTDASALERRTNRHLMSSFHAVFSIGNLVGAFLAGQILSHGGSLSGILATTGIGVIALAAGGLSGALGKLRYQQAEATPANQGQRLDPVQRRYLLLLGAIAFFALLAEGGMIDWSAVYIVTVFGSAESTGAYGFAIFATMMAVGRLAGDGIVARLGSTQMLLLCAVICAASVLLMICSWGLWAVFLSLALCGLGVANIVPAVFAAAGRAGGIAAGRAMSIVTIMGYAGLLLGPALLGFVAQFSSLAVSFGLVSFAFLLIAAGTRMLRQQTDAVQLVVARQLAGGAHQ